jgi:D-erythro-7,8-dihydroneopterin triphosphate epimerase
MWTAGGISPVEPKAEEGLAMGSQRALERIHIRDLTVRCIVGINDWEREKKQDVVINLTLWADLEMACLGDSIENTVNYKPLKNRIVEMVERSEFKLIERMAQAVADLCLEEPLVERVDVTVDKSGALRFARSVAVEITRTRRGGE